MANKMRMMKNYWIIGGIAAVVLAGTIYLLQQRSTTTSETTATPNSATTQPSPAGTPPSTPDMATSSGGQSKTRVVMVEASNFKFSPAEIKVKQGDRVRIDFTSKGGMHDLVVDGYNVAAKQTSSTDAIEFTADKVGTFEYYCSVGNHRQMGMQGKLIVE